MIASTWVQEACHCRGARARATPTRAYSGTRPIVRSRFSRIEDLMGECLYEEAMIESDRLARLRRAAIIVTYSPI